MESITLVTGGTGFIGGHLVETLVKNGRKVRCLVRKTSDITHLKNLGVELICGDLLDRESLKNAIKSVATVYHLAACNRSCRTISRLGELSNTYRRINVLGTKNLAEVCLEEKISKFIYFSSTSAVGPGLNLNENSPCLPQTDYGKSKLETEKYLLFLVKTKSFPAVIIRPGFTYGPRNPAMDIFFKFAKRGIFISIGKGTNRIPFSYISDLVKGAILAQEKGKGGDIFFIFEKVYTLKEYMQTIAEILGGCLKKICFSEDIIRLGVFLKGIFAKIFRLEIYPFHMDLDKCIAFVSVSWHGSIDKAKTELGYYPEVDLKKGLELTVKWYKDNGLL